MPEPRIHLSREQFLSLCAAIGGAYDGHPAMNRLLLPLGRKLSEFQVTGSTLQDDIFVLVRGAQNELWLIELVRTAAGQNPRHPVFGSLLSSIAAEAAADGGDPLQVSLLSGGHIMVNRTGLREGMARLSLPPPNFDSRRILVVSDSAVSPQGAKTGKSHSVQLITHVGAATGAFRWAVVTLDRIMHSLPARRLISPYDLADRIAGAMLCAGALGEQPTTPGGDRDTASAGDEQWPRWNQRFCDRLAAALAQRIASEGAQTWWLVIDSFNRVVLPNETLDLIKEIAVRINSGWKDINMVLLGFPSRFDPSVETVTTRENIASLTLDDLILFFRNAYRQRGVAFTDDHVAGAMRRLLARTSPDQKDFIDVLHGLLADELSKPPKP